MEEAEDEMVCDLAETYNILDFERLPVERVAVFVYGLRDTARIWQKLGHNNFDREIQVLIYDKLAWLAWSRSRAAEEGGAAPEPLYNKIYGKQKNNPEEAVKFDSPQDFKNAWEELRRKNGNNDRGRIRPNSTIG